MDSCWVITDGAAGNRNQALALAYGLGLDPVEFNISLSRPWSWLAPFGPGDPRRALHDLPPGFRPPWPALAVGCGRASATVVLGLKKISGGKTRSVQILDPRWRRAQFDAVIIPEHDRVSGANVMTTLGSLNRIDDDWLSDGRRHFEQLGKEPAPRTSVLVGGPVSGIPLDAPYVDDLISRLATWHAREGGSFLVSCSRRTPIDLAQRLRAAFARFPGLFWASDTDGTNPYAGLLGWADRIVVTPDSSNLLSEACAVSVPVYTHLPANATMPGKRRHLIDSLLASGHLHALRDGDDAFGPATHPAPLRELGRVVALLRQRLAPTSP